MALDLTLDLGVDEPEICVPLSVSDYGALMEIAEAGGLPLLRRMRDYYEDAEFALAELPALRGELEQVLGTLPSGSLREKVVAAIDLTHQAEQRGADLSAIAD